MPRRLFRPKLALANKRFAAILERTLKPGKQRVYDFESKEAAIASAEGHLKQFYDAYAEVWIREGDSLAPSRKIWPEELKKKTGAKRPARPRA